MSENKRSGVFDSQGDVIHHQPPIDNARWLMSPAAVHDRADEYILGGVCPFCKASFMDDIPRSEDHLLRYWDRGYELKKHMRLSPICFSFCG